MWSPPLKGQGQVPATRIQWSQRLRSDCQPQFGLTEHGLHARVVWRAPGPSQPGDCGEPGSGSPRGRPVCRGGCRRRISAEQHGAHGRARLCTAAHGAGRNVASCRRRARRPALSDGNSQVEGGRVPPRTCRIRRSATKPERGPVRASALPAARGGAGQVGGGGAKRRGTVTLFPGPWNRGRRALARAPLHGRPPPAGHPSLAP